MRSPIRKINLKTRAKNKLFKATIGITPSTAKRRVKKQINPMYNTKVSGNLKPKKKLYNKVYKKTSFSIFDLFK